MQAREAFLGFQLRNRAYDLLAADSYHCVLHAGSDWDSPRFFTTCSVQQDRWEWPRAVVDLSLLQDSAGPGLHGPDYSPVEASPMISAA